MSDKRPGPAPLPPPPCSTSALPACRRGLRLLLRGVLVVATALYFAFVATILILRYSILPNIGLYHDRIESLAGDALGLPVKVGEIQASWDGLDPALTLLDVQLVDAQGRPALNLRRVESVFSWLSALRLQPTFALLAVDGPTLHLRRDKSGHIFVAGFGAEGESDPRLAEWVLRQPHIRIRDAAIVWHDELRGAPPLVLNELQFGLDNRGKLHRFGLTAVPPERLAARLDLRGEWRGSSLEDLENWAGQLYAELDYADLAGWRDWIDYPVNLPRGRGALRLWLERDGSGASARNSLTADVALEDVRLRLGAELPELDLGSLRGRIAARQVGNQRDVLASRLELSTRDGLRVPPSDFTVHWQQNDDGRHSGTLTADYLDLDVLSRLAAHLPLDATVRQLLARHQPRGRLTELHGNWEGQQATAAEAAAGGENRLNRYSLRSRFADLGSAPVGGIPGAGGLAGRVSVDEKGGSLQLDSSDAWLELPAIFPESRVALNKLQAGASWKHQAGQLEVKLERLDFANDDAAGSARGTYRHTGEGPGEIDLSAHLNRANASAVWRYMPRVVNPNARSWLQRGLVSGTAPEAHLTLKGDLRHFPFRDKRQGQFLVTVKARDVRLDYAPGWPVIEGIDGELRFEGPGMKIDAQRGAILGARLHNTKVEIPDFDVHDEMLQVDGQAAGPTSEFLRFIAQSPISAKIDHFTEEMQATGNGRLRLNLQLPLSRIDDSKIRGEYFFDNNQVVFLPGLPPFSQVNGRLDFSEAAVNAKDVAGNFLGSPARLSARSQGDLVGIVATGGASIRELRKLHDLPVFNALSGSSPWRAEIRVRKKNVDLQIESSLQGIASSLPEPLNKSATQALPLRLERMAMDWQPVRGEPRPVTRERWRVQLGKVLDGTLVRRQQGEAMQFERAVLAVGEPAQLPDKGLNVVINVPRLPLESWRDNLLGPERGQGAAGAAGFDPSGLPPPLFILRTPLLEAYGRS
ncbi:MAG: hypothetical protein RIR00_1781, partial [Pseudomonadota bacterium]